MHGWLVGSGLESREQRKPLGLRGVSSRRESRGRCREMMVRTHCGRRTPGDFAVVGTARLLPPRVRDRLEMSSFEMR